MFRFLTIALLVSSGLMLAFGIPSASIADSATIPAPEMVPLSVQGTIDAYARVYGVSASNLASVMHCESGGNEKAINLSDPNGGSKGLFQFQNATFLNYSKQAGITNPDIWNPDQQIQTAAFMFSLHQESQWSCWKIIHEKP